jgi:hypothetical protein
MHAHAECASTCVIRIGMGLRSRSGYLERAKLPRGYETAQFAPGDPPLG